MSTLIKLLKEIQNELIVNEILDFNNIKSYSYKKNGKHYIFKTFENLLVEVQFDELLDNFEKFYKLPKIFYQLKEKHPDKDSYNISYVVNGTQTQFAKVTLKEFLPILKTLKLIVTEFIEQNDPYSVFMFGVNKQDELNVDKQKNMLYYSMSKNGIPGNYRLDRTTIDISGIKYDGIVLFKNK